MFRFSQRCLVLALACAGLFSTVTTPAAAQADPSWISGKNLYYWDSSQRQTRRHFPIGFWINAYREVEFGAGINPREGLGWRRYQQQIDLIKSASNVFNTVVIKPQHLQPNEWARVLDHANNKNMKVIGVHDMMSRGSSENASNDFAPFYFNRLDAVKNKPALLANIFGDDTNNYSANDIANNGVNLIRSGFMPGRNYAGYSGDGQHVALQSLPVRPGWLRDGDGALSRYANAVPETNGGTGVQLYPINKNGDIGGVQRDMSAIVNAAAGNRYSLGIIQAFNWAADGAFQARTLGDRWPTANEIDLISYMSLISGARGLIFYSFDDRSSGNFGYINFTQPTMFNRIVQVAGEVRQIENNLMDRPRALDVIGGGRWLGRWENGNDRLMIVINSSYSTKWFNLNNGPFTGGVSRPFRRFGNSLRLNSNGTRLQGNVPARSVEIYRVRK